jgi:AraC family chemosensory pili system transcriptional regulator ChpD
MDRFARRSFEGIEIARLDCSGHSFAPHFHDEFVVSLNLKGDERIKLDGKALEADEGAVTLYNPSQVQSSHCLASRWQIASMYVDPGFIVKAFVLSANTVFDRSVLLHRGAARRMAAAIDKALDAEVCNSEALEGLVQTLDEFLELAGSQSARMSHHVPDALRRVADRLSEAAPAPSLAELSVEADLTAVQLVRAFKRVFGLPPFAWALARRLNETRKRLERGEAIAHVAADLGFADQAHLTRRFRAAYGAPPGMWRRG